MKLYLDIDGVLLGRGRRDRRTPRHEQLGQFGRSAIAATWTSHTRQPNRPNHESLGARSAARLVRVLGSNHPARSSDHEVREWTRRQHEVPAVWVHLR